MQRLRHESSILLKSPTPFLLALPRSGHRIVPRIEARKRLTRRATDEVDPPRDPFNKQRAWRSSNNGPPPPDEQERSTQADPRRKEPFDAELLVLFGLPTLIILIPWILKDPAALAIIPLAFFIPGVRDVLLAVLRSMHSNARKARQFMKEGGDYRREPGMWAPPPRPPPPPPPVSSAYAGYKSAARGVVDISEEDFIVVEPGETSLEESYADSETKMRSQEETYIPKDKKSNLDMQQVERTQRQERPVRERRRGQGNMYSATGGDFSNGNSSDSGWSDEAASWSESEESEEPNRPPTSSSRLGQKRRLSSTAAGRPKNLVTAPFSEVRWRGSAAEEEELDADFDLMERRERRRRARAARRQSLGLEIINSPSSSSELRDEEMFSWRQSGYKQRNVPWYVRPIVVFFPFLKDWGGFM